MEEEILIVQQKKSYIFNFPVEFYDKHLHNKIHLLKPRKVVKAYSNSGGQRVIILLDGEKALELRAWLILSLDEDNYFITEVEEIY